MQRLNSDKNKNRTTSKASIMIYNKVGNFGTEPPPPKSEHLQNEPQLSPNYIQNKAGDNNLRATTCNNNLIPHVVLSFWVLRSPDQNVLSPT